jgi:hypothetical protein
VHFFAECPVLGKAIFAECLTLSSARYLALDKDTVSGSVLKIVTFSMKKIVIIVP